ncbi:MAG: alpha/beta hydrolase [Pseudomonadales bacterium]|nr:alpha/beta hydrolase [Pseudomonadales bacterium]MCP5213475.1 alpha/beta hydrolase [Pseudomonadales bacterium]
MTKGLSLRWDKNSIQRQWKPIDFDYPGTLSEIEQEYCRYYGIHFEKDFSHLMHGFGYCQIADFRLATHYFRPRLGLSKGTVLLLHGYFDHAGLFQHIIRFCLEQDYSVLIYDLPGHGLSTGEPAGINNFQQYVEVLHHYVTVCQSHFDEPWHLLGQSTGGAIAMAYLMAHRFDQINNPFKNIFLLAPLVRPVGWKKLLWLYAASKHWVKSVERKIMPCSHDAGFIDFLTNKDPLQYQRIPLSWVAALIDWASTFERVKPSPLSPIIIQGGEDTTIDWQYNLRVIDKNFNRPKIHFLPQARHHLVNESNEFREPLFDLLETYFKQ